MQKGLVRFQRLSLQEGFSLIADHTPGHHGHDYRGRAPLYEGLPQVEVFSTKLATFQRHGVVCEHCGVVGSYFAVEGFRTRKGSVRDMHINLYGRDEYGNERLFTSDHIMPKARGGSKHSLRNRQTLCSKCNQEKGNHTEEELELGAVRGMVLLPKEV